MRLPHYRQEANKHAGRKEQADPDPPKGNTESAATKSLLTRTNDPPPDYDQRAPKPPAKSPVQLAVQLTVQLAVQLTVG